MKAKYKNLNNIFNIKKEYNILWYTFILVNDNKKINLREKTSWIIVLNNIEKDLIKNIDFEKQVFNKIDWLIFFQWLEYINEMINKQAKVSGEIEYL